ncbi:hypothetical protein COCSADRAFT_193504 [Bipolaris sorokiniana ND90Pr]|uniref:RRM domain-containing protein n=1 Tax=Cochliobolus sativus (strain ND90Pr / ATCC 201652) TaxID=665912 RepID=M2STG3_COCSN|nr:uncharacterized protein COCSADRAFT_193504 [Bipolaris sorokiniana ND90Pr]EMD60062.1 hypothetical protein COCSADRAFT_193504 [Bipolaris sorokiniana ND90Pr]
MAPDDTKGKKRKSAPETTPKAKKAKKTDDVAASEPKPTRKSARKQASDFMDLDVEKEVAPVVAAEPVKPKKGKQSKAAAPAKVPEPTAEVAEVAEVQEKPKKQAKKAKPAVVEETTVTETPKETTKKTKKTKVAADVPAVIEETTVVIKPKKTKGGKKQEAPEPEPESEVDATEPAAASDDEDVAEDDQTAALLAGFSDDDSDDADEDIDFNEDEKIPKLSAKQRKAIKQAEDAPKSNQPGVIYVGRVPRGFYEPQMKKYFSQFGKVNQLRLSRNKKTGASKHYAFVEFQSQEVADIVARTMNNYLLFGHVLKAHLIPTDQVHPDLFKGAKQRFKVDPRNKKAGLEMERGAERSQWEKRVANENKRRGTKAKELKEIFDYEFEAPTLKTVDSVPAHTTVKKLKPSESKKLITDMPTEEATVAEPKAKKGKKGAKTEAETPATEAVEPAKVVSPAQAKKGKKTTKAAVPEKPNDVAEEPAVVESAADKKTKKDKKRKSDVALETNTTVEEAVAEAPIKNKRAKKEKESKPETIVEEVEEKKAAEKPKKASKKAKA